MTRRPAVVGAWLWAIVLALWAGRASYDVVRVIGPDVALGALALVGVVALAIRVERRGLPLHSTRTVTDDVTTGS
jgi:hypothetical protein